MDLIFYYDVYTNMVTLMDTTKHNNASYNSCDRNAAKTQIWATVYVVFWVQTVRLDLGWTTFTWRLHFSDLVGSFFSEIQAQLLSFNISKSDILLDRWMRLRWSLMRHKQLIRFQFLQWKQTTGLIWLWYIHISCNKSAKQFSFSCFCLFRPVLITCT